MLDDSINLLEELDSVSKIHILDRDDIDSLMIEFARRILATLHIERVNVWLFNQERTAIVSIGEYDLRSHNFSKDSILKKENYPDYFKAIQENKIVLVPDIRNNPFTRQLNESYSIPNDIVSLMDIPLRIGGELVGVICFEKTGNQQRVFSEKEQTFAFSISLVLASNLEARHRRAAQFKLEQSLKEKELLIQEINHRVKNNFSVLISLLRISRMQGPTVDAKTILSEYEQRILSMLKIQELLSGTSNYSSVNFSYYLAELVKEFKKSFPEIAPSVVSEIILTELEIPSRTALHLGLIVTEIFLNAAKHGYRGEAHFVLHVSLKSSNGNLILIVAFGDEVHHPGGGHRRRPGHPGVCGPQQVQRHPAEVH